MKWFTREWQLGRLSDEQHAAVDLDYVTHVERIRDKLPNGLRMLAEAGGSVSLHDGHFIDAAWKVGTSDVLLVDVAGWDAKGRTLVGNAWEEPRTHIRLAYRGASLLTPTWNQFKKLIREPTTEILHGEVDTDDEGGFQHRMLLWPKDLPDLALKFDDVEAAVVRFTDGAAEILDQDGRWRSEADRGSSEKF